MMEAQFMACDTCGAKSGSPTLCRGCLHNRSLIEELLKCLRETERRQDNGDFGDLA